MTPAKMAKKYHACCGSPAGAGMIAIASVTTTGSNARQGKPSWGDFSASTLAGAEPGATVDMIDILSRTVAYTATSPANFPPRHPGFS